MNKRALNFIQYIFFLGVGVFLLWLTLRKSDWKTILDDLRGANYLFVIPAVLMLLVSHFIRAVRWRTMMEPLGFKPGTTNTFLAVMVGYWANLAFPRLGEVLKCTMLARYEKIPADKLVGTIVAERAVDVLSLLAVLVVTLFSEHRIIGTFSGKVFGEFFTSATGEFSFLKVAMIVIIIIAFLLLARWLFKRLRHLPFVAKARNIFLGVWQGLISIRYIKNKWLFVFHSAAIWLLYLLSTYMGFFAMRDMLQYGMGGALSALTFGSFGMIIPSPGGIGSFQYAVQQVMLLYGVSAEKGLSLGMLIWISQTGFIIIFGTVAFMLLPVLNKRKKTHEEHRYN